MKMVSKMVSGVVLVAAMGMAGVASAKTCELAIEGNDAMQFNKKELDATGCTEVKLTIKHTGKLPKAAMGHNWVLSATADKQKIVDGATKAGPAKDYAATGAIAQTKLVGGGQSDTVTFKTDKMKKGGDYTFYCTFPGHVAMMTGKFKF
jgi:azurin